MNTPVAMVIFNRPESTERVFAAVAAARPPVLLLVADGPRAHRPTDAGRVAAVREIVERVDWPCRVLKNYADANMGVQDRVASGLAWVFAQVEEAIIVEDDIVPDPTFFAFCEEMLARYRDDERVGHINGFSTQNPAAMHPYSYYFGSEVFVWGWATWRRAFRHYDVEMRLWPEMRRFWRHAGNYNGRSAADIRRVFAEFHRGSIVGWDYQWIFACWSQNFLSVSPYGSLTQNIGWGAEATGSLLRNRLSEIAAHPMAFPLVHPPYMQRDLIAEEVARRNLLTPLPIRVLSRLPPEARTFLREAARRFLPS